MILKKVMIDNKVVFEEISFEDALKYENKEELVFTDEYEQDEFEDALEELEEAKEEIEELEEELKDLKNKNIHLNFNGKGFNFDFGNLFSMKSGAKSNKLRFIFSFLLLLFCVYLPEHQGYLQNPVWVSRGRQPHLLHSRYPCVFS